MEKAEFIESGLLESYVIGLTNPEESALVEDMINTYPDVKSEKEMIELALEDVAIGNGIEPTVHIFNKISDQLFPKDSINKELEEEKQESVIIPIQTKSQGFWKPFSIAASVGLLLVGGWAVKVNQENSTLNEQSKIAGVEQVFLNRKIEELTQRQQQASTFTQSIAFLYSSIWVFPSQGITK